MDNLYNFFTFSTRLIDLRVYIIIDYSIIFVRKFNLHVFKYLILYEELSVCPSTLSHVFPFCLTIVAVNTDYEIRETVST